MDKNFSDLNENNSKEIIKVSVRGMVEWILRSGDIDSRNSVGAYEANAALALGAKAHKKIQESKFGDYKSEVSLSCKFDFPEFIINLSGRADGIFTDEKSGLIYIDEIKSTFTPFEFLDGENVEHWGQAMCYAYIFLKQNQERNNLSKSKEIGVQITYFHLETEQNKVYRKVFTSEQLEDFIQDVINKQAVWIKYERDWQIERNKSIENLKFPFENYRLGQRELAAFTYRAIISERKLFANAPTGVGKTISTIFPAIKAMPNSNLNKIFYLTAKNIARSVAFDAIYLMQQRGLKFKTVAVTAKDRVCFHAEQKLKENKTCNPEFCEYARGHFDRINAAIFDTLNNNCAITCEIIEQYAQKHKVCPFEFSLDLSLFTDAVICDYNYVFDPRVYLRRFFQNNFSNNYAFLIDEAHNLVDRAREIYSAEIKKSQFDELKKILRLTNLSGLKSAVENIEIFLSKYKEKIILSSQSYLTEQEFNGDFAALILRFSQECDIFLKQNRLPESQPEFYSKILDAYFDCALFQIIAQFYDERYTICVNIDEENKDLIYKLFCLDPSYLIGEALKRAKSSVIFSATLTPLEYFGEILGGNFEDKNISKTNNVKNSEEIENKEENKSEKFDKIANLPSPFDPENLCLIVACDINTRYKFREKSYEKIADYIHVACKNGGNYLAFFPSYEYMKNAYQIFCEKYANIPSLIQEIGMKESERENFLANFQAKSGILVGFCVLGGVFSEGIDLIGDRLNGAIIIGVGLPKLSTERDIIKRYFNFKNNLGYEYAYVYPAMNKILQAAGRVIRTESDKGIVLLLDDRFNNWDYKKLFPFHWRHAKFVQNLNQAEKITERFII